MRIRDMNWMQVEQYLQADDRAIVPLGSTEQHGYLSLATDAILAERVSIAAAEPLGVPVFPVLPFGIAPYFLGFPGTISLRVDTYVRLIDDVLDSVAGAGFRRILLVNGHGGNAPGTARTVEWLARNPSVRVKVHDWWKAPRTAAAVRGLDPVASHASWMENFPWTRLEGVSIPSETKPAIDRARMALLSPAEVRDYIGDGNLAGCYARSDDDMLRVWDVGVAETREALNGPWQ